MKRAAVVVLLAAASCDCGNECSGFFERCDGSVLEACGGGVDQVIGRRYEAKPCVAPNPVCAEDGIRAQCVASANPCDAGSSRCEGNVSLACEPGFNPPLFVAQDCSTPVNFTDGATLAGACVEDGGRASCRYP